MRRKSLSLLLSKPFLTQFDAMLTLFIGPFTLEDQRFESQQDPSKSELDGKFCSIGLIGLRVQECEHRLQDGRLFKQKCKKSRL